MSSTRSSASISRFKLFLVSLFTLLWPTLQSNLLTKDFNSLFPTWPSHLRQQSIIFSYMGVVRTLYMLLYSKKKKKLYDTCFDDLACLVCLTIHVLTIYLFTVQYPNTIERHKSNSRVFYMCQFLHHLVWYVKACNLWSSISNFYLYWLSK